MDNNNKKDNKKESSIGGIIAFVIAIMVLLGDDFPGIFGILVVGAAIAVIIYAVSAAKKRQAKEGGAAKVTADDLKTGAKTGFSKLMTEAKKLAEYDDPDHDDDHEDVDPSEYTTEDEKRVKQLKSMLKNGIIDKEEYNIMLKRYKL